MHKHNAGIHYYIYSEMKSKEKVVMAALDEYNIYTTMQHQNKRIIFQEIFTTTATAMTQTRE